MKRFLLLLFVVGLFAGQAFGGMYYVLDASTASSFDLLAASDAGSWPGRGSLDFRGDYSSPDQQMRFAVGFAGDLGDRTQLTVDTDNWASVTIGKMVSLSGYSGFSASLANDDDDPWSVQLYLKDATGTHTSGWELLAPYTGVANLSVAGSGTITEIGFVVLGTFVGGSPSNPDVYHISAVPIPGAVLLGFLGLSAAGLGLRKLS